MQTKKITTSLIGLMSSLSVDGFLFDQRLLPVTVYSVKVAVFSLHEIMVRNSNKSKHVYPVNYATEECHIECQYDESSRSVIMFLSECPDEKVTVPVHKPF